MNLSKYTETELDWLWKHIQFKKYKYGTQSELALRSQKIQFRIMQEENTRKFNDNRL